MSGENAHIVLCAALGRGHLTPMMGLAQALASTKQLSITIIFPTKGGLDSINKSIFTGLDVEFIALAESDLSEVPPWMTRRTFPVRLKGEPKLNIDAGSLPITFPAQEAALESLLCNLLASPSPPICLVNDFTITWAAAPAQKLGLPRYVLYTDPACFMAVAYHSETLVKAGILPLKDPAGRFEVPGLPPLLLHDVSRFVWDSAEVYFPMQVLWHDQIIQSDGVLVNTFYELESSPVDALRGKILSGTHVAASLFTVGPLISSTLSEDSKSTAFESPAASLCIEWLNSKAEYPVVFVSFGSWENLPDDQISELAIGLELSGCSFLWAMNEISGSRVESLLPEGYWSRVIDSGRGLIVSGWAPQQAILSHPAVCGFVTQCGWNSVLECVCLAGVPMICWPFMADQPTSCRFLVDGLKIAVEVCEDENGRVSRTEIQGCLKRITTGDEAEAMKFAAKDLRRIAGACMNPDNGSSRDNVNKFIKRIKHFI